MEIPPQDFVFIADESGISNDRFTVVGGVCLHRDMMKPAYETLAAYRSEYKMSAELKWSKVSDQKIVEYSALVDHFFALNRAEMLSFHALIFDNHIADHRKFNQGDRDIGLSKLYYQLIFHKFIKTHGRRGSLYVRLDHRNSSTPLETMRRMLNSAAARDLRMFGEPLKQCVSFNSTDCDILQMNDVILGAVCAARNGRHLMEGGRRSKRDLAQLVLERSGLVSFEQNTKMTTHHFTLWNMKPYKR
jgi:hypothetical protein